MSQAKTPAILLGGEMISLAVARSLSPAGIPVYALGHRDDPLRHSRHRRAFTDVGTGPQMLERMWEWLERGPREGVLLPCGDEAVELVGERRAELEALGYIPFEGDDAAMLDMLDKEGTYARALTAGVEAPWVGTVHSLEEGVAAAERVGYPCALKPRHSHRFAYVFGTAKKAFVVSGPAELERALESTLAAGLEMMVAEIVAGPDNFRSCYSYLDAAGEPLWTLTKRKLRQLPPGFGAGTYHLTTSDPEVAELGVRFFRGAGLRGLVNVEFKPDGRDGRLKLIECNHRFSAATEQLRRCGADTPLFMYNRLTGLPAPDPSRHYRHGVGFWYPLRDTRAFLAYRRRGELTFARWARSLMRPQRFPLASFEDPMPSLLVLGRRLRGRIRRRRSRARPAADSAWAQADDAGNRSMTSRRASSTTASRPAAPLDPASKAPTSR